MPRLHAIIHGHVQGVGFRADAAGLARRLRLKGWVRNLHDRTVETVALGPRPALDEYLRWLNRGPEGGYVSHVDADWLDVAETSESETYTSFEIRYDSD